MNMQNQLNDTNLKTTIESLQGAKPALLATLRAAIEEEFKRQLLAVDQLREALAQSAAGITGRRRRARKLKVANGVLPSQSTYAGQ